MPLESVWAVDNRVMLRLFHAPAEGGTLVERPAAELDAYRAAPGWIWLDATGSSPDEIKALGERFGFDTLALEDVLEPSHFPKIDDFGNYLFLVLHGATESHHRLATGELDAFLGADYLVTLHQEPSLAIDFAVEQAGRLETFARGGPDLMLARIAEWQGRRYLPIIEELDHRIEELESSSMEGHPSVIGEVQALRRDVSLLRRVVGPQREVLLTLSGEYSDLIDKRARLRFSSVYDHHYRLIETLDASRNMLGAVLDTYRSTVAERMNEVMKVLTVYAAILLPLSLLAGIYGMNFVNIPELEWRIGYFVLIGLMASIAIAQWVYFSRRGFIGGPSLRKLPGLVGRGLTSVALLPVRTVTTIIDVVAGDEPPPRDDWNGFDTRDV